jgi:hypothetical protein
MMTGGCFLGRGAGAADVSENVALSFRQGSTLHMEAACSCEIETFV